MWLGVCADGGLACCHSLMTIAVIGSAISSSSAREVLEQNMFIFGHTMATHMYTNKHKGVSVKMQHRNNLSFEPCCSEFLECLYLTLPRSPSLFGCTPDLRYIHFKKDTSLPVSPPQEEVSQVFFKHKCCVMCVGQLPG